MNLGLLFFDFANMKEIQQTFKPKNTNIFNVNNYATY